MFFHNIYVSAELQDFVLSRIEGGKYSNFGELTQAALRALEREERGRAAQRSPSACNSATLLSDNTAIEDALYRIGNAKAFRLVVAFVILFCGAWMFAAAQTVPCKVRVSADGFRNQAGVLGIAVYKSPAGWPEESDQAILHESFKIVNGKAQAQLTLAPGRYAIAAIHDENGNHKLDRNLLGVPKEGFGFSNNPPVGISAPSFSAASFAVSCPVTEISIHMIYK
jgi:uncharacterized protein (DUF2141 family)/Arc/MetJ-type ribon-helix-helix transcriptional regulator